LVDQERPVKAERWWGAPVRAGHAYRVAASARVGTPSSVRAMGARAPMSVLSARSSRAPRDDAARTRRSRRRGAGVVARPAPPCRQLRSAAPVGAGCTRRQGRAPHGCRPGCTCCGPVASRRRAGARDVPRRVAARGVVAPRPGGGPTAPPAAAAGWGRSVGVALRDWRVNVADWDCGFGSSWVRRAAFSVQI
jgi:hypothetical protein